MKTIYSNLINGNLVLAKAGAKKYSANKLAIYFRDECGMSHNVAFKAAQYLKQGTQEAFDAYCAAEREEKVKIG